MHILIPLAILFAVFWWTIGARDDAGALVTFCIAAALYAMAALAGG